MTHRLCIVFLSIIVMLSIALTGCGSSDSGSTSYWGGDSSGGTTTTAPQVTSSVNLNNPGQPIRPGDWIQINGPGFGSTQGANYVQFTNGTGANANADLYSSWTDTQIVCRLPADALKSGSDNKAAQWGTWGKYRPHVGRSKSGKLTKDIKNTLRGKYHLFGKKLESTSPAERTHRGKFNLAASTFWTRDTWTFKVFVNNQGSTPTNINANPTPNPTPSPGPPSPSPTPSPDPTSTPSPSPTPTTSPSPSPSPTSGGGGGGGAGPTPTPSKITIAGEFQSVRSRNGIAMANTDGSLNTAFDPGAGIAVEEDSEYDAAIYTTAVQTVEGKSKILIGGWFSSYNGNACSNIARLNTDGSFDDTFNPGEDTGADDEIYSIVVQEDGKILIGGAFTSYTDETGTTTCNYIARLNAGGTLDTTFNVTSEDPLTYGAGTNGEVYSIAVQADGQILIGGWFTQYNETARSGIARVTDTGALDASFNPGTGVVSTYEGGTYPGEVISVALQSDGKVIIGGDFSSYNETGCNCIARLTTTGPLDPTFNSGTGPNDCVNSIALQSNGKVILGGYFTSYNSPSYGVAQLNTDGTLYTTFNPGANLDGPVRSFAVQSDGKVIIGGKFTHYGETPCNYIARLNADGSLDGTFNVGGEGASRPVNSIALQADGKILIGGEFGSYNGTDCGHIARLTNTGALDGSLNSTVGADNSVFSIAVQSDGKILIGGFFTSYTDDNGEHTCNYIARLTDTGALDPDFAHGAHLNNPVCSIAVQSDGKILIGGWFTLYNDGIGHVTNCNYIARLNTDGTLNTDDFAHGMNLNGAVYSIAVQPDSKILIGGDFESFSGVPCNYIARLNTDGSLDTANFAHGANLDDPVYSITVQSGGKILIGGEFTYFDEILHRHIVRLDKDGKIDTSFSSNTQPDGNVGWHPEIE